MKRGTEALHRHVVRFKKRRASNHFERTIGYYLRFAADCDNVAHFLLRAGYAAIVAGQETLQEVSCANFRAEQDLWDSTLKDLDKA